MTVKHKWTTIDESGDQQCSSCEIQRVKVANDRKLRGKPRGEHWEYVVGNGRFTNFVTFLPDCRIKVV